MGRWVDEDVGVSLEESERRSWDDLLDGSGEESESWAEDR